jgi:hypothetical protein
MSVSRLQESWILCAGHPSLFVSVFCSVFFVTVLLNLSFLLRLSLIGRPVIGHVVSGACSALRFDDILAPRPSPGCPSPAATSKQTLPWC